MKKVLVLALLSIMSLTACGRKLEPEESCNFVQNSQLQRVSWKNQLPIEIYIHKDVPQDYYAAIQSAMVQWEERLQRPVFKIVGIIDGPNNGGDKDGRNVIYYMNSWESDKAREQGRTTIYWLGDMIYEADIRLNGSGDFLYSFMNSAEMGKVDMESLVLHELGHVLGLQHNDSVPSVMATTLGSATFRRDPKPVDVESLRCEYK